MFSIGILNFDIIYNHIEKQKGDFVVPIEIDNDRNLQYILTQYIYKHNIFKKIIEAEERRKRAEFNSNILMPYFSLKWSLNSSSNLVILTSSSFEKQNHSLIS